MYSISVINLSFGITISGLSLSLSLYCVYLPISVSMSEKVSLLLSSVLAYPLESTSPCAQYRTQTIEPDSTPQS